MTGKRNYILPAVLLFAVMLSGAALSVRAASRVPGTASAGYTRKDTGGQEDDSTEESAAEQDEAGASGRNARGGYDALPDWIVWNEREIRSMFSWETPSLPAGDREPAGILLSGRKCKVCDKAGEVLFETPDDLFVQDVLLADADRDGAEELVLLCWRRGRFDRIRPFWITEPEQDFRQHIYIYDWRGGEFRQRWMASDILVDVFEWSVDSMNVFLLTDPDGKQSRWAWDTWGLSGLDDILASNRLTFLAAGDNIIHASLLHEYRLRGSFDFLFDGVRERVREADLAVLNQETPFVTDFSRAAGFPRFGTPYTVGTAIRDAGFDIVSCATNHALDQGLSGIRTTAAFFAENSILYAGIQSENEKERVPFRLLQKRGIRTAVLNYTEMTNGRRVPDIAPDALHTLYNEEIVRSDLRAAREAADLVLVLVHWGTEYGMVPDDSQRYWSDVFLSEGADIVIGTHPHVLQPYELRVREDGHEMLVYYSLGNFCSAQGEAASLLGGLAQLTVAMDENGIHFESYGLEPVVTHLETGAWTTYLLSDYTEELAARNEAGVTLDGLQELYRDFILEQERKQPAAP